MRENIERKGERGREGGGGYRGRQRGRRLEQGGERLKEKEAKQSE